MSETVCRELRAFLDNELGWLGSLRMKFHLRRCPACQQAKTEHERLDALLAQAAQVSASERLLTAWQAGIPTPTTPTRGYATTPDPDTSGMRKIRWAGISATVLIMTVLVVVLSLVQPPSKSVLVRAVQATESARTVHVVLKENDGSRRIESWSEGLQKFRIVTTTVHSDGKTQQHVMVRNRDKEWDYQTITNKVHITDGVLGEPQEDLERVAYNPVMLLEWALEMKRKGRVRVEEYEERLPNGQAAHVVVVSWIPRQQRGFIFIDLSTNRLVGLETQELADGQWRTTAEIETIEYDKPLPQELFTFEPPAGAKVVINDWWKDRRYERLAEDTRANWRVVIHSVDVARDGTVFVSLFRTNVHKRNWNEGIPPWGRLIDERGRKYAEHNSFGVERGYWTLTFSPIEPLNATKPLPQWFTIELSPYAPYAGEPEELPYAGETMRFENVLARPLPPELVMPNVRANTPEAEQALQRLEQDRRLAIVRYKREYGE